MTQTLQAAKILLNELEARTGLREAIDAEFFSEWRQDLPDLDDWERQSLDRIRAGFFNLLKQPPLLENTVRMSVLDPLLFTAGLYLAPFFARPEQSISILLSQEDTTEVEGRMDALVLKDQLWFLVIEAKRAGISVEEGVAQLLAYLWGTEWVDRPVFGLVTNGHSFLFAKLLKSEKCYALSDLFALRRQENELYSVVRVIKYLAALS